MRRPLVAVALVFAVVLSGPFLAPTPFQPGVTEAARESSPTLDCPSPAGKGLPFHIGRETSDDEQGWVDLVCQYRKKDITAGAPQAHISAHYYVPSRGSKGIGGSDFCWKGRLEKGPELLFPDGKGGQLFPEADHYISVQFRALGKARPKQVKATAVKLAKDLVEAGDVLGCDATPSTASDVDEGAAPDIDGAAPEEDPDAVAVPDEELSAAAQAYLDVMEQYRARAAELCALAEAAEPADAPADAMRTLLRANADYVEDMASDLASLSRSFPPALEAELDALIFARIEEARRSRELAGDEPSTTSVEERTDAAVAASEASNVSDAELRRVLGIPPKSGGSGAGEIPCEDDEGT